MVQVRKLKKRAREAQASAWYRFVLWEIRVCRTYECCHMYLPVPTQLHARASYLISPRMS
jgi:hypothetical protein